MYNSGRYLYLLWAMLSLMLTSFYTCNLRANLISPELEKPVSSAEDVVARELKLFLPNLPNTYTYFALHPSRHYRYGRVTGFGLSNFE